jgi:DNA modification methylase
MAISEYDITDRYSIYLGDCLEVSKALPDACVDFSIYSPPFGGLYQYSSSPRDLSNCLSRTEFFEHYEFVVREKARITKPGRMSAVHCTDIPSGNTGLDHLYDFPGDIIRLHEKLGFQFVARHHIWKEPLTVRNRTMVKSLSHKALTIDSSKCSIANADQLIIFRNKGKNAVPIEHPEGLKYYAGDKMMPSEVAAYENWKGPQIENRFSHWIWRQYADAWWTDVRIDNVLPHREARDEDDEKHCHPLQLDVIDRGLVLWSNPNDVVWVPFAGVGSEVYCSVSQGRKCIGVELKPGYYRQMKFNMLMVDNRWQQQAPLFHSKESDMMDEAAEL